MQCKDAGAAPRTSMGLLVAILVGLGIPAAPSPAQTASGPAAALPPATPSSPATIDYQSRIHPILAAKCLVCHSQEKRSGGLSLATYEDVLEGGRSGAALRPGDSKDSLILMRLSGETQPRMPLGGEPLAEVDHGRHSRLD